jgi:hypothetical protein
MVNGMLHIGNLLAIGLLAIGGHDGFVLLNLSPFLSSILYNKDNNYNHYHFYKYHL